VVQGAILNEGNHEGSNPFTIETIVKVASICAAVIYGVLFIGYRTYYNELGITPEDVGVGSAFVLVRSIGFIALVIGAVLLWGLIVNVLDSISKEKRNDVKERKENAKARRDANPGGKSDKSKRPKWKIKLSEWGKQQPKYILRSVFLVILAVALLLYLLAVKPLFWQWQEIVVTWLVLPGVAWFLERVAGQLDPGVGLVVVILAAIVIAIIVPGLFVDIRAHDLADSALSGSPPDFTEVKPYSILNGRIPVLDVSSDKVDVEWICTDKNKKRPSVFDGRDISPGELLGESPSSLFVRMDPLGKTPIVKLPAECVVITRYEDTPISKR
jgi:hypothetical protein